MFIPVYFFPVYHWSDVMHDKPLLTCWVFKGGGGG